MGEENEEKKVLLIESNLEMRNNLTERFRRREGWSVAAAKSGSEALEAFLSFEPDLIVLDRELCDMDGKDILCQMPKMQSPLLVLLSSKTDEADKVICLGVGADAYLEKPASERLIEAECMALFRRREKTRQQMGRKTLAVGKLCIDPGRREVKKDGGKIDLTKTEFDILLSLARRPGEPVKREEIASRLQGFGPSESLRFIDTHVKEIRKKIGPFAIKTVRGVGYALREEKEGEEKEK